MPDTDLQKSMINDANVILQSIDFLENLINKKLKLVDIAIANSDTEQLEILKKEIYQLLRKLRLEEKQMDVYMVKYKKLVQNEKEKMLHNSKQKK